MSILPLVLQPGALENIHVLRGHLANFSLFPGETALKNSYTFNVREYPDRIFKITGLREADQGLLVKWEGRNEEFSISIHKEDLDQSEGEIPVYGLSSDSTEYLSIGTSAQDDFKSKVIFISFGILSLIGSLLLFKWANRKSDLEENDFGFDPAIVQIAEHPKVGIAAVLLVLIVPGIVLLPAKFLFAESILMLFVYIVFLFWLRSQDERENWFQSVLERNQAHVDALAQGVKTVAPKHVQAVQAILDKGLSVDIQNQAGRSPLHIAAEVGELEAVGLLLKNHASVNLVDSEGNTPLMLAADAGHLGVVLKLIQAGTSLSLKNKTGKTALQIAQESTRAGHQSSTVADALISAERSKG